MNEEDEKLRDHPAFESGCLDFEKHRPLVRDIERVAQSAGLGKNHLSLIWTPLCKDTMADEREYMATYHKIQSKGALAGMYYSGKVKDPDVMLRMMSITACFVRNYVDARMLTLQEVNQYLRTGEEPKATVLLVPNFYLPASGEGNQPSWLVSGLYGLLLGRWKAGQQTILYVKDFDGLRKDYGIEVGNFVSDRYAKFLG